MAPNDTPSLLVTFFMFLHVIIVSSGASDSETLLKLKESLQNKNKLTSWIGTSPPCSGDQENWVGVHCSQGKIWGLTLENMGLKGVIDVELLKLLPDLRTLSFMNNNFNGPLPDLKKLSALKSVHFSHNKFSGEIPSDAFLNMVWLKKVHLADNRFTGSIPTSLISLPKLLELRLEDNQFQGKIPGFQLNSLQSFDVSNNKLEGPIPASLSRIDSISFSGESFSCDHIF